jgi:hypothetical protein
VTAAGIEARRLRRADASRCDDIVASLPYFFGDPNGIELCRRAVREEEGLVALIDGQVVGFPDLQGRPSRAAWRSRGWRYTRGTVAVASAGRCSSAS